MLRNNTLQASAALSYYSILAVFPGLIFLSAVLGFIPLPDLFGTVLIGLGRVLPADTMKVIYSVLADVLAANRGTWLSVGMLGTLWVVSSAFDAMIEGLDMAYDVSDTRPFWKTRILALALAGLTGLLLTCAIAVLIVGPEFGEWLAARFSLSAVFLALLPVIHWTIALGFTVLAVEALYFLAPNVKQKFVTTLPGAILAVAFWVALSSLLGIYFRHFTNYNRTYGTLGGFIALMVWFYWTSFFFIAGAELNAELAKEMAGEALQQKPDKKSGDHVRDAA